MRFRIDTHLTWRYQGGNQREIFESESRGNYGIFFEKSWFFKAKLDTQRNPNEHRTILCRQYCACAQNVCLHVYVKNIIYNIVNNMVTDIYVNYLNLS